MAQTDVHTGRPSSRSGSTVTQESSSGGPNLSSPATVDMSAADRKDSEKKTADGLLTPATQDAPSSAIDMDERQGPTLLSGFKFWAMYFCMLLSIFLVALDVTLVSTAQTVIVADLGGVNQIAWVVTAFLLTQASFMLFYGQVLSNFASKPCYLSAIVFFEVGSLICGVAQNMVTLIIGRAIAGIGASGIMISAMTILAESTTLQQRASLMGGLGVVFGISMVLGPLIGGAIAQHIGWRYCFYINLPAGALSIASIVFLLSTHPPLGHPIHKPMALKEKISQLDFVGLFISLGFLVAITLPLQDGGITYSWTDGRVLGPLIASAFILALLIAWCAYRGREHALIPLALLKDRNLVGCALVSCFCYLSVLVNIYYLPRFYQAVFGSSPTKSGVDLLPSVLSMSVCSFLGGMFAGKTGHYYTQMAISPLFGIVGSAMLYRINYDTSRGYLIGAQILVGIAMGACIQAPILAAQANVKRQLDISRAVGIVTFVQRVGGTIGNGIASGVFFSLLPQELSKNNVPAEYAERTLNRPETMKTFPEGAIQDGARQAFSRATADVLVIGLPTMAINLVLILLLIKCTNLRTKKVTPFSQIPAAIVAGFTRRNKSATDTEDAASATKDIEKADDESVHKREVEDEVIVASLAIPNVAREGEAILEEDAHKRS
ncbi:unnamed protein product [Tilletia controversa]|uniref:Major facilitator superfamily (MFS) profile domain-containing protein n=1 Tax=Tilletia controversa TaxID=13291 RepID=A0A8X7MKZ3_9BASI|nr:hypothetical protein CF328_g6997 [Tilletia controversa]KAE8239684.1 hypothetical protein A4X06_0g8101 [Tilletia controversa]CAD6947215.1 unnamed protein product [Tilletia controversa]CAD6966871.1 unnamed protein product [Tilletia controversa]